MLRLRSLAPLLLSMTGLGFAQDAEEPKEKEAEGFANPELLVTTAWLAEHGSAGSNGGDGDVVVVDVRSAADFATEHVPGAVSIPTASTYDPAVRGNIGPIEQIAALLGAQGISAATHVVIYDEGRSTAAARVFWTLEVYGHEKVSVVDGGFAKWKAEERETTSESAAVTAVEYVAPEPRPGRLATRDQVLEGLDDPDVVLLDTRSDREYAAGCIPNAIHIDWVHSFSDDEVPVLKSPAELRKLYADQGVTSDKRVHAY